MTALRVLSAPGSGSSSQAVTILPHGLEPWSGLGGTESYYQEAATGKPKVIILGDSITVAARLYLHDALRAEYQVKMAAWVGEGFAGGPLTNIFTAPVPLLVVTAQNYAALGPTERPDVVVLALGTNDAWQAGMLPVDTAQGMADIIAAFPTACIVAINVTENPGTTSPDYDEAEAIAWNADLLTNPDIDTVVDWATIGQEPGLTQANSVHLTDLGSARRAIETVQGVADCLGVPATPWTAHGSTISNIGGPLEGQVYPANRNLVAVFNPNRQPAAASISHVEWFVDGVLWRSVTDPPYNLNPSGEYLVTNGEDHQSPDPSFGLVALEPDSSHSLTAALHWDNPPTDTVNPVNFTNDFTIAVELTPTITVGPNVEVLGTTSLRITWTTSVWTDGRVRWSSPAGDPPYTTTVTEVGADRVNHSITITGLTNGQVLQGDVQSFTPGGLGVTSGEWTGTTGTPTETPWTAAGTTMQTLAGALNGGTYPANASLGVHLDLVTQPAEAVVDYVEWEINDGTGGYLLYRTDVTEDSFDLTSSGGVPTSGEVFNGIGPGAGNSWQLIPGSSGNAVRAKIFWLDPPGGTTDPAVVTATFSIGASSIPVITDGPDGTPISTTQIRVDWVTDVPSDSQVEYGPSPDSAPYALNKTVATLVTAHSVLLTSLTGSTDYDIRVRSANATGNSVYSGEITVQTVSSSRWTANGTTITVEPFDNNLDGFDFPANENLVIGLKLVTQPPSAVVNRVHWWLDDDLYRASSPSPYSMMTSGNPIPTDGSTHTAPSGETFNIAPGSLHNLRAIIVWQNPPPGTVLLPEIEASFSVAQESVATVVRMVPPPPTHPSGIADAWATIQGVINSAPNNCIVRLQPDNFYRADRQLKIEHRTGITLDLNGSTIKGYDPYRVWQQAYPPGGSQTPPYPSGLAPPVQPPVAGSSGEARNREQIRIFGGSNIGVTSSRPGGRILGPNTTAEKPPNTTYTSIDANYSNYDTHYENNWAIGAYGTDGVEIWDVKFENIRSDFIRTATYIDDDHNRQHCKRVHIHDNVFTGCGRQGFGFIMMQNVWVHHNTFDRIPRSLWDFEANGTTQDTLDVVIEDNFINRFRNNFIANHGYGGRTDNIVIRRNDSRTGIGINANAATPRRANWWIYENRLVDSAGNPVALGAGPDIGNEGLMLFQSYDNLVIHDNWQPSLGRDTHEAGVIIDRYCGVWVHDNEWGSYSPARSTNCDNASVRPANHKKSCLGPGLHKVWQWDSTHEAYSKTLPASHPNYPKRGRLVDWAGESLGCTDPNSPNPELPYGNRNAVCTGPNPNPLGCWVNDYLDITEPPVPPDEPPPPLWSGAPVPPVYNDSRF